jgi:Zn-dependent protease
MAIPTGGAIPLFRVAGIQVSVHWSWILVALWEINNRSEQFTSVVWNAAEYVTLFLIVLLHEFGHALACRQVGGIANQILLWPLGGVAFVQPPPRPGPFLWSIAAGPLVNFVLLIPAIPIVVAAVALEWPAQFPNLFHYLVAFAFMNGILLVFNLLPVYPLDGGQILQCLLWFFIGRAHSLLVVSVIGLVVGLVAVPLAILGGSIWFVILAAFVVFRSLVGFSQARRLARLLAAPRRKGLSCPSCEVAPRRGEFWRCSQCRQAIDAFAGDGLCPSCGAPVGEIPCLECQKTASLDQWLPAAEPAVEEPGP